MYKTALATMFIASCLVATPMFASNFFKHATVPTQKADTISQASKPLNSKDEASNFVDFTGSWVGSCTDSDEILTVSIDNTAFQFTVDGITYAIGSLDTRSFSNEHSTNFFHILLEWNADHSILLFNDSYASFVHMQEYRENNFGSQKGSISLKGDQLIYEQTSQSAHGESETFVCTYKKLA